MDPRVTKTRAALIDAVLELVASTEVADLTIAAVCTRAGVSRVAFYDRFGTMDALLVAAMEDELDRVRAVAAALSPTPGRGPHSPPDDLVEMFRIIAQHAELYRTMLGQSGSAGFLHRMREVLRTAVAATMHRIPAAAHWPVDHEIYYDFIAGATVSIVIGWLEREPRLEPDEVARQFWWLIAHRTDAPLSDTAVSD